MGQSFIDVYQVWKLLYFIDCIPLNQIIVWYGKLNTWFTYAFFGPCVASGHVEHVSVREWFLFYGIGRRLDRAESLKSTKMFNQKVYVFCAIWAEALLMYIKYGNCYVSLIVYLWIKSMIDMESLSHDSHMPLLFLVPLCFCHIEVYIWHNIILYLLLNSLSVTAYPSQCLTNCRR